MTRAAYEMLVNKLRASNPRPAIVGETASENEPKLHRDILEYCRERSWIAFHGSTAHRTHRQIGEPDFCCCLPFGRVVFVEVKSKAGKLSVAQAAIGAWLTKLGHEFHVVRSMDEFIEAVRTK